MKKVFLLAIFVLVSMMFSSVAFGANCGGSTPCNCGDTINESRVLNASDDLINCTGYGLTINTNNITIDCDGYNISGPGTSC